MSFSCSSRTLLFLSCLGGPSTCGGLSFQGQWPGVHGSWPPEEPERRPGDTELSPSLAASPADRKGGLQALPRGPGCSMRSGQARWEAPSCWEGLDHLRAAMKSSWATGGQSPPSLGREKQRQMVRCGGPQYRHLTLHPTVSCTPTALLFLSQNAHRLRWVEGADNTAPCVWQSCDSLSQILTTFL